MKLKLSSLLVFIGIFSADICASRLKTDVVRGTYTYEFSGDMEPRKVEFEAIARARVETLESEYGTLVKGSTLILTKEEQQQLKELFVQHFENEAKGEWVCDKEVPTIEQKYVDGQWQVKITVCGLARKIETTPIDIVAQVLCNGTDDKHEASRFKDDAMIYLKFRSPKAGHLAVYLVDEMKTASCLLPYANSSQSSYVVEQDRDYVLFSQKHAAKDELVDEYVMTCTEKQVEYNLLYIIFSPNEFVKANTTQMADDLPRVMEYDDFIKWLNKNRLRDVEMQVETKPIVIEK